MFLLVRCTRKVGILEMTPNAFS